MQKERKIRRERKMKNGDKGQQCLAVSSLYSMKNHWGHLCQMLAGIIRRVAKAGVLTQRGELCTEPTCPGIRISLGLLS